MRLREAHEALEEPDRRACLVRARVRVGVRARVGVRVRVRSRVRVRVRVRDRRACRIAVLALPLQRVVRDEHVLRLLAHLVRVRVRFRARVRIRVRVRVRLRLRLRARAGVRLRLLAHLGCELSLDELQVRA